MVVAAAAIVAGVLASTGAASTEPSASASAPADPPSFLHILTDDQTIDSLAAMAKTEKLLVRRGTRFTDYNAVQPLCCPSRASFLTGQYPHNHGVLNNKFPFGYAAMDFSRTIYTALDDAGYRTGWIGQGAERRGLGSGSRPRRDSTTGSFPSTPRRARTCSTTRSATTARYAPGPAPTRTASTPPGPAVPRGRRRHPFLLTLASIPRTGARARSSAPLPAPAPAPPTAAASPAPAIRSGPTSAAVAAPATRPTATGGEKSSPCSPSTGSSESFSIGQLRRSGRLDDTYVIFQSDNGMLHGEHGIFDKNVPWDRSVRVPLIIRGPGFAAGTRRSDLTANVDVPATILDAAGVAPPLPRDG